YHLVNMLLHIGCGMLVYTLFAKLLKSPLMTDRKISDMDAANSKTNYLPLFAALLFICHPLQTQAVTYIIQRFVPLATFFYLAALVLYLEFRRASTSPLRAVLYGLSVMATLLAMESKEIAFTIPVIIALIEFMFYRGAVTPRLVTLLPFFLMMAIIPAKLLQLPASFTSAKTDKITGAINLINVGGVSSLDYLMTQFGVMTTYLRLLFVPINQKLDYDYPLQNNFFTPEVLLPLALLLGIAGLGFYLLRRSDENRLYKIAAFGIFWFFITLSVESGIVPIEDLIFEHRAYLPSIGIIISLLAGASILFTRVTGRAIAHSKGTTILLLAIVSGLTITAIVRNTVWQDEVIFWKDNVLKSPNKARPHRWLGAALLQQSREVPDTEDKQLTSESLVMKAGAKHTVEAAINTLRDAIRINPANVISYQLLAEAWMLLNNFDEAFRTLSKALDLDPRNGMTYSMRGALFEAKKETGRARQEYLTALSLDPSFYEARVRLAGIYKMEGDIQAAIKELEFVMQIYPDPSVRKKLDVLKKGN
ncbi:MAG: hypothetical protein PHI31_16640, partial [Desulfuromonadaceae bacterium]|nr:hypothetical protein [Desulfuromonadaceae bacterium]